MTDGELKPIEDSDMDSMFILPLSIIPLQTPQLRSARLVKNGQLKSVVELFRDSQTGSGQIDVEDLPAAMNWPSNPVHPDLQILRRLSLMPSYDVYSLRMSLRSQQISVNDISALKLSDQKMKEITDYMMAFTRPLLKSIYGSDDVSVGSYDDLMRLFRDPDIARARERLNRLANTLGINLMDVPGFLEDYGDTFLSLSYYRHSLDRLAPYLSACLDSIPVMRKNYTLKQDHNLMRSLTMIETAINQISTCITGRLEVFERSTTQMWDNISREEFQKVKAMIERYHLAIGGALCGLSAKMNDYAKHFPTPNVGGPVRRADFMSSEMTQGIDLIRALTMAFQVGEHERMPPKR